MVGDVQMVEIEDQEMYRIRYVSQTAISAVKVYICITKMKTQNLKVWKYMNPKTNPPYSSQ